MHATGKRMLVWLASLGLLTIAIFWVGPSELFESLGHVGLTGLAVWMCLTITARWIQSYITVIPLRSIGFTFHVMPAFWLGWIRTFGNQVLPLSGVATFIHIIQRQTGATYSQLSSLAIPQFLLAATAVGLLGLCASAANHTLPAPTVLWLVIVYGAVSLGSIATAMGIAPLFKCLPTRLGNFLQDAGHSARTMIAKPVIVPLLIFLHICVLLLRGARLLCLFYILESGMTWQQALLVTTIAESTMLIQLTPGGLIVREGAIVGGANLAGIPMDVATMVALIDRILVTSTTSLLLFPAISALKSAMPSDTSKAESAHVQPGANS